VRGAVALALVAGLLASQVAAQPALKAKKTTAEDRTQPVTVDADQMEAFRKESLVVFTGSVVARHNDSVQYADRMEVYLDEKGERLLRIVSTGNIRIVTRDCRTATAKRVEYYDAEQRVELLGNARVWEGDNVVTGEKITLYLNQERSVVEGVGPERVKAVFQPRDDSAKDGSAKDGSAKDGNANPKPAAPCVN
jgi:lipopolysaccharide export system protein LptA